MLIPDTRMSSPSRSPHTPRSTCLIWAVGFKFGKIKGQLGHCSQGSSVRRVMGSGWTRGGVAGGGPQGFEHL